MTVKLSDVFVYLTPTAALGAIGVVWKFFIADPLRHERERANKYEQLWRDEVKLGAKRALMPRAASDPPPKEIPLPEDWHEDSKVTRARKPLEKEVIDEMTRNYVQDITPTERPMFQTMQADVVIIDDDHATVTALHRLVLPLVPKSWRVAATVDPEQGRLWLLEPCVKFAIIDLNMPKLHGEELITEMISIRPELRGRIVICSGMLLEDEQQGKLLGALGCLWLPKPSPPGEFRRVVRQAITGLT